MIQKNKWKGISLVTLIAALVILGYNLTDKTYFCSSKGLVMECERFSGSQLRCYPNLLNNMGYRDCPGGWEKGDYIKPEPQPEKTIKDCENIIQFWNETEVEREDTYICRWNSTNNNNSCNWNYNYTNKIVLKNESLCIKTGKINVSGKIYEGNDAFCKLQGNKICCYSNKEGGEFAAFWRTDGSVDKECIELDTKRKELVSSTGKRFIK